MLPLQPVTYCRRKVKTKKNDCRVCLRLTDSMISPVHSCKHSFFFFFFCMQSRTTTTWEEVAANLTCRIQNACIVSADVVLCLLCLAPLISCRDCMNEKFACAYVSFRMCHISLKVAQPCVCVCVWHCRLCVSPLMQFRTRCAPLLIGARVQPHNVQETSRWADETRVEL